MSGSRSTIWLWSGCSPRAGSSRTRGHAELRGLSQPLAQSTLEVFSPNHRCRFPIEPPELAGCTMADVVKCTCWLDDAPDFGRFNAVYASYFGDAPPARSTVRSQLILDGKLEVEAIA